MHRDFFSMYHVHVVRCPAHEPTHRSEIASQPAVWEQALRIQDHSAFGLPDERVLFFGCGTSAFIAESLACLRERAGLGETDAAYASEWKPGRHYDRVVAITRSGTTSEVLSALATPPTPAVTHGRLVTW